jgi:cytoskeletal protein CcmA (bactofilin family)
MKNQRVSKRSRSERQRVILVIALAIALLGISLAQNAHAQAIVYGDAVPAGQMVENDVILNGTTVQMNGVVDGDMLAIGNTVEINGTVNGSLVAVGQNVTINGEVLGTTYTAGVVVTLDNEADLNRNLYTAALQLVMNSGSAVARDVYVVSPGGATLQAQVGRNFVGIVGPVEFIRSFLQWFEQVSGLELTSSLLPGGDLVQAAPQPLQAGIAIIPARLLQQSQTVDSQAVLAWLLDRLRELVTLLVVAGLAAWLVPNWMQRSIDKITQRPWAAAGWGFLLFITTGLLLAALLVAIFLLSMFFYSITLGALGSIVLFIGGAIVLVAWVLYIVAVAYVSKAIFAIFVGQWLLKRFAPQAAANRVWPVLLGVFLYVLVRAIPIAGWIVGTIATVLGLGAMWLVYLAVRETQQEVAAVPELEFDQAN